MFCSRYLPYFLLVLLISCKPELELTIIPESFSEMQLEACKIDSCPEISVQYLFLEGEEVLITEINNTITQFCIESLYIGDQALPATATTIPEAAEQFVAMYRTHSAEFPDMQMAYFADVVVMESYFSKSFLSLELRQYLFTGGAHGYGTTQFANFDLTSGKEITNDALFKNFKDFERYAEEKFRARYQIPVGASINSNGFWFDDDQFYLPESIGITSTSLIMIYNAYEIASYADGAIELEIPIAEVETYLAYPLQ